MLAATLVCANAIPALACTGFYFGRLTTAQGTSIWGRTEDISANYSKLFIVHPAQEHEPGSMYISSSGFSWPYPPRTLRYTLTPDSIYNEGQTPQPYAEVGMNEKNVAITATVTLSSAKSEILALDSMVRASDGGVPEQDLASVVLMQAESARHAVELVAHIVDTVGSAERNGFTVADPNEIWYMEILSGHQYVAVKCPPDKIGLSPNITMMGAVDVNDTENVIASPKLIEIAQQAGTLVLDNQGRIKVAESYARSNSSVPSRLYDGYEYLKGKEAANALQPGYYEYFIDPRPGGGYTLYEVMRLMAHGSINRAATVESHVFETRYDVPADLATVLWLAMGPAEFSIFIPYYANLITETFENYYKYDSPRDNRDYRSMYWLFRDIYTLCTGDRDNIAPNVAAFLEQYQKKLIEQHKVIDAEMAKIYAYSPALAQQKATQLSLAAAQRAFEVMTTIREEILAYKADPNPDKGIFTPSLLSQPIETNYTFAAVDGTGLPVFLKDDATGITVEGEPGALDYGTELLARVIGAEELAEATIVALDRLANKFQAYEIKLILDGEEVQPNSALTLSFPIPEGYDHENLILYKVMPDGSLVELPGEVSGGFFRVTLDQLSIFVLAEKTAADEAEEEENGVTPPTHAGSDAHFHILGIMLLLAGFAALAARKGRRTA